MDNPILIFERNQGSPNLVHLWFGKLPGKAEFSLRFGIACDSRDQRVCEGANQLPKTLVVGNAIAEFKQPRLGSGVESVIWRGRKPGTTLAFGQSVVQTGFVFEG